MTLTFISRHRVTRKSERAQLSLAEFSNILYKMCMWRLLKLIVLIALQDCCSKYSPYLGEFVEKKRK